jgi:hypothetical protein
MCAAGLFDSVAPLLPACDIGPTIERLPRDAPAPLMLCRDAGSFWAGDVSGPLFGSTEGFDPPEGRRPPAGTTALIAWRRLSKSDEHRKPNR